MKLTFPVVLQSPDGRFFRRIQADGYIEKKTLGMEWEPAPDLQDSPYLKPECIERYVTLMTERLHWKLS